MIMRKDQLTENGLEIYVLNSLMFYIGNSLNEIEFKQFISKAIKEREVYCKQKLNEDAGRCKNCWCIKEFINALKYIS